MIELLGLLCGRDDPIVDKLCREREVNALEVRCHMRHESNRRAKLVADFVFVDVLHRLVCNDVVIEHVGYAPREVFLAMIDFEGRME